MKRVLEIYDSENGVVIVEALSRQRSDAYMGRSWVAGTRADLAEVILEALRTVSPKDGDNGPSS